MRVPLTPLLAKVILRINTTNRLKVMCLGYDEDYELFTELVWEDDKNLDFNDKLSYTQFQIWYV